MDRKPQHACWGGVVRRTAGARQGDGRFYGQHAPSVARKGTRRRQRAVAAASRSHARHRVSGWAGARERNCERRGTIVGRRQARAGKFGCTIHAANHAANHTANTQPRAHAGVPLFGTGGRMHGSTHGGREQQNGRVPIGLVVISKTKNSTTTRQQPKNGVRKANRKTTQTRQHTHKHTHTHTHTQKPPTAVMLAIVN